jgi:hypothetical protein
MKPRGVHQGWSNCTAQVSNETTKRIMLLGFGNNIISSNLISRTPNCAMI